MKQFQDWTVRVIVFCAVGTCVCFGGLAYLQVRVADQAAKGRMARDRQTAVYPVSLKVYLDAYERGKITRADLDCFRVATAC